MKIFRLWGIPIHKMLSDTEFVDENGKLVWAGLLAGFIFGAVIGQYVVMAMQSIVVALDIFDLNRTPKTVDQVSRYVGRHGYFGTRRRIA